MSIKLYEVHTPVEEHDSDNKNPECLQSSQMMITVMRRKKIGPDMLVKIGRAQDNRISSTNLNPVAKAKEAEQKRAINN